MTAFLTGVFILIRLRLVVDSSALRSEERESNTRDVKPDETVTEDGEDCPARWGEP